MRMGEEGSFCLSPPPPFRCVLPLPPLRPKVWGARKIDTTLVLICISTVTTRDGTAEREGSPPSASASGRIEKYALSNDTRSGPSRDRAFVQRPCRDGWIALVIREMPSRAISRAADCRHGSEQRGEDRGKIGTAPSLRDRKGRERGREGKGHIWKWRSLIQPVSRSVLCLLPPPSSSPLDSILSILCNGPDCRMSDRK